MAGEFEVRVEVALAPQDAWARVWDLRRHTAVIPLTRVETVPPATPLDAGVEFCGRTALGPVGFEDPMRVVVWDPPSTAAGRAVVTKTGRVIGGRIEVAVDAAAGGGSLITWRQVVTLPWLPSPLAALERVVARLVAPGYRLILGRLLA